MGGDKGDRADRGLVRREETRPGHQPSFRFLSPYSLSFSTARTVLPILPTVSTSIATLGGFVLVRRG